MIYAIMTQHGFVMQGSFTKTYPDYAAALADLPTGGWVVEIDDSDDAWQTLVAAVRRDGEFLSDPTRK